MKLLKQVHKNKFIKIRSNQQDQTNKIIKGLNELRRFSKKQDLLLGISFSANVVKVVEITHNQGRYFLNNFAIYDLVAGEIEDGNIVDCENMGCNLAKIIARLQINSTYVATAISDSSAIIKVIDMPVGLTDIELEAQIMIDADQYIPYPLADVSFDFEVLGYSPHDMQLVQVLMVASLTETISQRVDALAFGGLEANVIELESHAIERAFGLICDSLPEYPETVLLVDIGHTRTTIYVAKEGVFVYSLEQLFGGYDLTSAIQTKYSMTFDEATDTKHRNSLFDNINHGLNDSLTGSSKDNSKDSLTETYNSEVFQPFVEQLAEYIKHALQLYNNSSDVLSSDSLSSDSLSSDSLSNDILLNEAKEAVESIEVTHLVEHLVDHLVLFGGSAMLDKLPSALQNHLNLPVSIANPFSLMSLDPQVDSQLLAKEASGLMTACGLALRSHTLETIH